MGFAADAAVSYDFNVFIILPSISLTLHLNFEVTLDQMDVFGAIASFGAAAALIYNLDANSLNDGFSVTIVTN